MKVVYIHQHFGTRGDSKGTRSYEFGKRLVQAGHEVVMICGRSDRDLSRAEAKHATSELDIDGIRVLQADIAYSNKLSFWNRVVTFLRFMRTSYRLAKNESNVDVGLMILDNIPAFYESTSPNKFFDYLASGLPVLNNYPGWIASIIERAEMGLRSRKLAETESARDLMSAKFIGELESAIAEHAVNRGTGNHA